MKLFGKAKKGPTPQEGITKMRETLEMLEKREAYLQNKINHEIAEAKRHMANKNKRAAMMCLKKKKTYESQIEKLAGANMTIQTQLMAIEGANVSLQTLDVMNMGARIMKDLHKNMTVDDVDRTMDDIQTQMDLAADIDQAISQPLGGVMFDEDELDAELEALEQESLDQQLLNISAPSTALPSQPVTTHAAPAKVPAQSQSQIDEEAELRALEDSMAL
jgi:charged multivesicular body protein 4